MNIRPHLRARIVRTITTTLFLSLFTTFPFGAPLQSASAATTITKTVTIKGSNNALYNGAQVALLYYVDGDKEENLVPIQTTGSSGQVTISYPANASYAHLFITPPLSDTTNAVQTIDLLTSSDAAIANVVLKASNIRVKVERPDGTSTGLYTCVDYPKQSSSRWVTTQYRTTRAGAFGLAIPTTLNAARDYHIQINPCNKEDYKYLGFNYGLRRASNGSITLYTDDKFTTTATASGGVFSLKLDAGLIRGTILGSDSNPLSLPSGTYVQAVAMPILSDGSYDQERNQLWSKQTTSDGNFVFSDVPEIGIYEVQLRFTGDEALPNFTGGRFWVNASGKFSTTVSGTYTSTLDLTYTVPSTGITSFKFVDTNGSYDLNGGSLALTRVGSLSKNDFFLNSNSQGLASGAISDGTYQVIVTPNNSIGMQSNYTLVVVSGVATFKDSANNTISKTGNYFPIRVSAPTFKFRMVSPDDTSTTLIGAYAEFTTPDFNDWIGDLGVETTTSIASVKASQGSYALRITPYGAAATYSSSLFTVAIDSSSVTIKSGETVITPVNGIYLLSVKRPVLKGEVLNPAGTESIRWSEVRAVHTTNPKVVASTQSSASGTYALDLPIDGTYRITATPPYGVNANHGVSESVTVVVTNGVANTPVLNIRLRAANISGIVTGPTGIASPNNWLTVSESKTGSYLDPTFDGPYTDEDGGYSLYLPTGSYGITPSSDYPNAGGVANGPKSCSIGANPATPVTCDISLVAPNLTGTVTIGGSKPAQFLVGFAPPASASAVVRDAFESKYGGMVWSTWSDINTYGVNIDSGTYRMWINYQGYDTSEITIPGPLCVVSSPGTSVCDAAMPAANFTMQIADWNSNPVRGRTQAAIQLKEGSSYFYTCCSYSIRSNFDGKISLGLLPGSYRVIVSEEEGFINGIPQTYFFDINSSGSPTNVRLTESGTAISAVSGLYTLALKEPIVTGRVYGIDGITPEPYAVVAVSSTSGQFFNTTRTDRSGRFTFDINGPLTDGTYYLWSTVPRSLTKGSSKFETFTVQSGRVTTSLSIKLNTPNVVGTASGPTGVSSNSFVQVRFPSGTPGIFQKIGGYTYTDSQGKFAFWLPAGTYTFYGETDYEVSGGVSSTSGSCVVSADTVTVTTCNIAFASPNVTGTLSFGGINATNSNILFFPAYGIANNTATDSYGWINMPRGKYGIKAGPGTYRTYVLSSKDTADGYLQTISPGTLCKVPATGSVICNATLPASNFNLRVKSATNTDLANSIRFTLEVKNGDQFQSAGSSYVNDPMTVPLSLVDGSYKLRVDPDGGSSLEGTAIQYIFDVTSDAVTNLRRIDSTTVISPVSGVYNLPLNKPNVSGTVSGPKGAAQETYIEVNRLNAQGQAEGTEFWAQTNSQGKFALNLPVGIYILKARPDFASTGGADTSVRCEVTSDTTAAITCNIALATPNVSGTIRINGAIPSWGSALLQPAVGIAGNTATEWYGWVGLNNGVFGFNAKPGTYRINLNLPSDNKKSQGFPAGLCVVPETGTVVCNVNIPATNFIARVLNTAGTEVSNVRVNLSTESGEGLCCIYLYEGANRLSLNLVDGSYGLQVSLDSAGGGTQNYQLRIESGTVTSLKVSGTTQELTATNGLYSLSLRPPTFSGTVYKSNGTSPAPFTQVFVEIPGVWGTSVDTDDAGKFAIDIPQHISTSRVNISASPNRYTYRADVAIDKSQGSSAVITESATAGVGSQSIVLRLRPATITGRITGSKGALANRYISIQQLDGTGSWNWVQGNPFTDKNGDYSEYLAAGTYRLYSSGESKGGGETYGNPCTITSDSSTAVTCNMTLVAPNISGTAKFNSANIQWGDIQFIPDQGTSNDKSRRYYYSNVDQGEFATTIQPNTYQISIGFNSDGKYFRVFGPKCVVPESGTVTCNINIPAVNLTYKVLDSNNALQTSNVYSSLEIKSGDMWNNTCCSYPDGNLRDGKFESPLIDGQYRLIVRPSNSSISGSSRTYTFVVESATVKNFSIAGSLETITPTAGVYTLKLSPAAISGTVYKSNGTTGYVNARVCARPASIQQTSWRMCTQSNESGKYTMEQSQITDGVWEFQAFATGQDLSEGASVVDSITVTSGIGSKIANLTLRAPNFTGVVSGPRGVSPNNYLNVRKYFDNGDYTWLDIYFVTDSQGRFAFTLEPGRYRVSAGNDMVIAGGTSTVSDECVVTAGNSTTCNVALSAPNITGKVQINGLAAHAWVEFLKETVKGFDYAVGAATNQNGEYALKVDAGTYRPRIYLYSSSNYMLGPPCVVPETGTASCNINLPSTNIRFKVNSVNGSAVTSGVGTNFYFISGDRELWAGNTSLDSTGVYRGSLIDGTYRLELYPNNNDATIGTASTYKVTIESGSVTSFTRDGSSTQLVATSNIFTLALGIPSISGTVVAPDGTTPVPNSRILAFVNPYGSSQTYSDKNAAFAFSRLPDGTYSVIAAPGWEDATKAPSAPQQITVNNGLGVSDLRLVLRTPNVTGIVRGPTSKVSIRNWLEVEQKMEGNWWKRPDYFPGVMTTAEGSYSLNLAPGIYRIRANGDMDQAGGVSTSTLCTVPSTGTVTCDITLKAPNLKIRVVAPSGSTTERGSYAWAYLQSATDESAILNRNPNFQWVNGGDLQAVLEDGTWIIRTEAGENPLYSGNEFTVTVSQGVITRLSNSKNETITATNGIYLLPLLGSNLSGSITFNGAAFDGSSSVNVLRQDGEFFNGYSGKWVNTNEFGFTLPVGNYKIEVVPYGGKSNGLVSTSRSALCVVESVESVTVCNVALKSPNLKGKVTDKFGQVARFTEAYILMQQGGSERWLRWLELRDGLFDTYLEDGTYRIQVMPRWDYRKTYTDRSYIIKVESGTVQSVTDQAALVSMTPSSGTYSFTLGTPSVTGKVFNPGTSTGAAYTNIQVAPSSSPTYWRYSTQSDANGEFALTIPDGTYVIQAVPNNGGFQFGKSETRTITISGSVLTGIDSVTLVLRQPNFQGRVVLPNSTTPLANVNVNIYIDGEYAYGWTDSDGRFSAYVDNPAPQCPSRCSVYLNYYKSSEYTPKYYAISTIGNVGDLAIGGITSTLTVLTPQGSGAALPSKGSWVTVERRESNGARSWITSGSTNDLGKVGLSLTNGESYTIWAYPNGEQSRLFAPKKLDVNNYAAETNSALSITFAQPNVRIKVLNANNADNIYGWFTVSTWDSPTATQISNGSLDSKGYAALTLDNGNYQLRFWPGKGAKGVQKIVTINVNGSTITATGGFSDGTTLVDALATITLPSGNISGSILSSSSTKVASALVAAYRADDESKFVTTSSDANGNYQINLDLTYSWTIKSVDPISGYTGSLAIASRSPSNDVLASQNVTLSTAP